MVVTLAGAESDDAGRYQEIQVTAAISISISIANRGREAESSSMKPGDQYHRFVHWSEEDRCCIGYCPDLYFGGVCHAGTELEAYSNLYEAIQDEIRHRLAKGETLPTATDRIPRDLGFAAA